MNRLFLRAWNGPGLILIAILLTSIQTTLFTQPWTSIIQPDFFAFLVVWCGMKRKFLEGGILSLLLGYIAELQSSSPQGLYMGIYMGLFLLVRFGNRAFILPSFKTLIVLSTLALKVSLLFFLYSLSGKWVLGFFAFLKHTSACTLIHFLISPIILKMLIYYDRLTLKDIQYVHAMEEGFEMIDEGF